MVATYFLPRIAKGAQPQLGGNPCIADLSPPCALIFSAEPARVRRGLKGMASADSILLGCQLCIASWHGYWLSDSEAEGDFHPTSRFAPRLFMAGTFIIRHAREKEQEKELSIAENYADAPSY